MRRRTSLPESSRGTRPKKSTISSIRKAESLAAARRQGIVGASRQGTPCPRRGAKGDVGHLRFPMSPLDTPLTFHWPLSEAFAAKRGLRGLGSVRRAGFGTLLCPEVSLRYPPRISVRGQTVQGGGVPLRKAPLRSRVCPWSSKRPCGPLAFRRATEGSRVQRKGWGVKRGRETLVSLPLLPPPPGGGNSHAMSWRIPPTREGHSRLRRQAAGTAERHTLC